MARPDRGRAASTPKPTVSAYQWTIGYADLPPRAKAVGYALRHLLPRSGRGPASVPQLAEVTGLSPRSVDRGLADLEAAGLLESRQYAPNRPATRTLRQPEGPITWDQTDYP